MLKKAMPFRMFIPIATGIGFNFNRLISPIRRWRFIYLNVIVLLCLYLAITPASVQQENHPPVVKIISPRDNSIVDGSIAINYEINVADKEDGDSRYDEINNKEVLLEVKAVKDKSSLRNKIARPDPPALTVMRTSNCFNCHNFNGKSIGPSFYEISKRYPVTAANTDTLMKRIRMGSSEVWGKEKMPAHPELTREQIKATVNWILKRAAEPGINYYIGATGTFRIKKAGKSPQTYILTASYLDHGPKSAPGKQRLKGQDIVYIYSK